MDLNKKYEPKDRICKSCICQSQLEFKKKYHNAKRCPICGTIVVGGSFDERNTPLR